MDKDKNNSFISTSHKESPLKRARIDQDPDYDEAAPPDLKRLKCLEDNARLDLAQKVSRILTKQLEIEVERQQSEIAEIEQSILKVQQNLLLLRYVAARSYYTSKSLQTSTIGTAQPVIHPAVKNHIGKKPKENGEKPEEPTSNQFPTSEALKVPRYIPPKIPETIVGAPIRGERHCIKKKLIIGNVSKWIPVSERDDSASHKWMVYVRGSKEEPDISPFVSKVVFFLHPSYAPHDVVPVSCHPFHVTRRGWGEFPLRVQVFFHNPLCKPINIIHHLKLDRSYTGLQTLGAETIVDVMVFGQGFSLVPSSAEDDIVAEDAHESVDVRESSKNDTIIKQEPKGKEIESNDVEFRNSCNFGLLKPEDIKMEVNQEICEGQRDETSVNDNTCTVKKEIESAGSNDFPSLRSCEEQMETSDTKGSGISPGKDCDHDYYRINAATASAVNIAALPTDIKAEPVAVNKIILPKSSISQLKFNSILSKQYAVPTSSVGSNGPTASSSTVPSKPVLVRCISKNGTPVNLPLTLFRSAVVIKPYHLVKPGESLLRPPLIRARHEAQGQIVMKPASAVRIVGVLPSSTQLPTLLPKFEVKPKEEKIDTESKYLQERNCYDQFISSIQSNRWDCVRDCVRVLARHFSLVDSRASDPIYRSLRPFTAPSLQSFTSWNMGKQRSAEWTRANLFRKIIEQCKFTSGEMPSMWTTKRILIWCRRQGYSPICCWPDKSKPPAEESTSIDNPLPTTLTTVQVKSSQLVSNEEVNVDVEAVDAPVSKKILHPLCQVRKEVVPLDDPDPDFTNWVCESVEKLGFKLGAEPFDDAYVSFSRLLIAKIWKNMAEDLIRRSLRESWQRTGGFRPNSILLSDTISAAIRRPEFDMLTNNGLGSSANSRL